MIVILLPIHIGALADIINGRKQAMERELQNIAITVLFACACSALVVVYNKRQEPKTQTI